VLVSLGEGQAPCGCDDLIQSLSWFLIEANYDDGPCGHWRPGDADLGTWDIISSYGSQLETISHIEGSNSIQTAYRLERAANLTLSAQEAFPRGTPFQFSFECTYRQRKPQPDPWHLFHLTNSREESQLSVTLNPGRQTLQVSLPDARGALQTVEFRHASVSYFPCSSLLLQQIMT
jgi:collagen type IX alpha